MLGALEERAVVVAVAQRFAEVVLVVWEDCRDPLPESRHSHGGMTFQGAFSHSEDELEGPVVDATSLKQPHARAHPQPPRQGAVGAKSARGLS